VRTLLFALAYSLAAASPASAMTAKTAKFLREKCGLDPKSEEVQLAERDGTVTVEFHDDPVGFSLEWLAAMKRVRGVKQFVTTRNFIHKLKADFAGTAFPKEGYEGTYLTREERILAGRKIVEDLRAAP